MDPTSINALVMALSGRNPPPQAPAMPAGPQQGPGMDLRTQGLINALAEGGPNLGQTLLQQPGMDLQNQLEQQKVAAGARTAKAAESPEAGAALRNLLTKWGASVPEGTPNATLEHLLPTAEKTYGADQLRQSRLEVAKLNANSRIVASGQGGGGSNAQEIGDAIISGQQAPDLKGMYRQGPQIRAYLSRQGFDLAGAQREWAATQKHIATMNGQQQERLRQAVDFTSHSVDTIQNLYDDWKAVGAQSGIKAFNKASLAVAKNLPGDAGAAAQALEAQIGDLTAELGNVYMGGNSPTDHALQLAGQNLSADWNEQTFKKAIGLIKTNLKLRANAMNNSGTAGGSRYDAKPAPSAAPTPTPQAAPAQDPAALRKKYGL